MAYDPHSGRRVVALSKIHLPPKNVLVIPRKRWLCPYMTEKLLTGTENLNPNKQTKNKTCFLPLQSYEIEIRNSFLGYKNQFTIVCGKEHLALADKSRAIQTGE